MIENWFGASKRDHRVVNLYSRHYSSKKNGKTFRDWLLYGITAPGEDITLLTPDASALFVWLKQQYRKDEQVGVECSVFRNEAPDRYLSSGLILEAERLAWRRWPNERLFTFVDPEEVAIIKVHGKPQPGFVFRKAGWRECGLSDRGLIILEKLPQ